MPEIFGIVLSVSFSIAYVPQIIKMVSRKSSSDVSLIMLLVNGLGYGSGVVYVVMKELDAFWLRFNYIAGFVMTIFCVSIWMLYKEKGEVE